MVFLFEVIGKQLRMSKLGHRDEECTLITIIIESHRPDSWLADTIFVTITLHLVRNGHSLQQWLCTR